MGDFEKSKGFDFLDKLFFKNIRWTFIPHFWYKLHKYFCMVISDVPFLLYVKWTHKKTNPKPTRFKQWHLVERRSQSRNRCSFVKTISYIYIKKEHWENSTIIGSDSKIGLLKRIMVHDRHLCMQND